jgi:hypothetical protein
MQVEDDKCKGKYDSKMHGDVCGEGVDSVEEGQALGKVETRLLLAGSIL